MEKIKKGISVLLLVAILFSMSITNVFATDSSEPKVYDKGTNTLNLEGEFTASGYDAAIYVHSGAKLTINGSGKVHAYGDNGGSGDEYATAVWAYGEGSEITINGGTYTNEDVGDDHVDLIYAKAGGKIVINGGTFECATPKWTLNLHDTERGEIVVKGGTFYKFNPADADTEPGEEHFNYVAPGYGVIQDGDWYTVIKTEYASGTNTLNLSKDITANGFDAAIYVHSGAKLTINGSGKVHAYGDNGGSGDEYATAVWAYGEGSEITINGGTYTNEDVGDDHVDLIYAKAGGKIVINGGTFECATPKWTLNLHDTERGEIVVKGGTFYKFNPADAQTEPGVESFNYVASGYRVVQNGDWYTVYKEHTITVKEAEGGKVIVREVPTSSEVKEINKAISGETVEVVVEPAEGYKFKEISGIDGLKDVAEYAYQFTMPNKDVVLTPVFEKYTVEADASDSIVNQEEIENVILESFNEILKEDKELAEEVKNKDITVELNVGKVDSDLILEADIKSFKDALSKEKANAKLVTEFIEITVDIFDKDSREHIVSLSELKEPVTLRIPVPEGMEKLPEGYERVFYVVREHIGETDLEYTVLDAKLSADGKYLEFTTDRFSLYAVAYNDVEKTPATGEGETGEGETEQQPEGEPEVKPEAKPETPDVPKTGDNVVVYVALAIIAVFGIVKLKRVNTSKRKH